MTTVGWQNPVKMIGLAPGSPGGPWHARVALQHYDPGTENGGWFHTLGTRPDVGSAQACRDFLEHEGVPSGYLSLALPVVLRDMAHDQPDLAIKGMRYLVNETLGYHDTETVVLRALALLCRSNIVYELEDLPCG